MAGILLVHGAWHGPWCWDGFAQRLAGAGHDVRTVRLRGHDGSPGRLWYRVSDYVRDVSEAVNRFPEPPVVVGHSLGGLVVAKYLERGRAEERSCLRRSRKPARSPPSSASPAGIP